MKPEKTIKKLEQGEPVIISALGDSLTYGWLVNKGYLDYLHEMLLKKYPDSQLVIMNNGIPGDTASGGLKRLEKDVIKYKPDAVLIQFALNDAFTGYSPSEYSKNIQEIISHIKDKLDADVILITSIYMGYNMESEVARIFYNVLDKIAEKNNIPIARVDKYWESHIIDKSHFITFVHDDLVHPNEDGYKLMAEAIMEIF
jgi:acyl-CoA thioesterase I